jgi:hypothetical protein
VVEGDVEEGSAGLREHVVSVAEVGVDVDTTSSAVGDPGGQRELVVDEGGAAEADEDSGGDRREAVPGREQTRPSSRAAATSPPWTIPGPAW